MNRLPVFLICGEAGVGKDTVGDIIRDRTGFTKFAQADTIKIIAQEVFGFTAAQLWGPSENRNAVDTRWAPGTENFEQMRAAAAATHSSPGGWGPVLKLYSSFVTHTGLHEYRGAASTESKLVKLMQTFYAALVAFAESKGGLTARIVLQLLGTEVGRAYQPNIWVDKAIKRANAELISTVPGVVVTDGRFRNEIVGFRSYGGYAIKITSDSTMQGSTHQSEAELKSIPNYFYDAVLSNNKADGIEALRFAVAETIKPWLEPRFIRTYA